MDFGNQVFQEDIKQIARNTVIPWQLLKNKTIFITGGTGLIGFNIIHALLYVEQEKKLGMRIVALVRDKGKAVEQFAKQFEENGLLKFVTGDVRKLPQIEESVDYIIHGASPTASRFFVEYPVETIRTAIEGTMNVLEFARERKVLGFVYLSSMEVYGYQAKGKKIFENDMGGFDTLNARNSYPIGKQMCENICSAYAKEYEIPIKIARLTQCFGMGVNYMDGRVFAEFARCAIEKRNIVLKTKGETERCYIYTADAVSAILIILLKGKVNQAYNVANENTYCSILEMAEIVAKEWNISVDIREEDVSKNGYANTLYMDLDTQKLRDLGWNPTRNITEMYRRMMEGMKNESYNF